MLYYLLFWAILGFIIHFYIIFGTNLLTRGPAQICCFMPISVFRRKGISNGVETERNQLEKLFLERKPPDRLEHHVRRYGRCSRGWGRAPCLVGPPKLHRRTSCTHIYSRTLKLPEQTIDREFRRRKPPEPRKTNRDPFPVPCRRGDPSPVAIFIIPALSMTRRE